MPSWGEIQEYARSKFTLSHDTEHLFALVFEGVEGRTQLINVRHFAAFEKDWLEFRSFVCKEADMNPRVALRKNDDFAVGALGLDEEGRYFLSYTLPLDTMDPEEFDVPLQVLARTADALEKEHASTDDF